MLAIRCQSSDFDVLVAGGGPAGAAFALRMARKGWSVGLADPEAFPRDKVCGDFVGPAGLVQLRELGLTSTAEFRGSNSVTRAALYLDGKALIERDIPRIEGLPGHGRVIPRAQLDNWLWAAAVKAGAVPIRDRVKAFHTDNGQIRVELKSRARPLSARLLIGADGSASTVSRVLHRTEIDRRDRIVAVRAYYAGLRGDPDCCDLYFASESFPGYYWVFPTARGGANVGVGMVLETLPPTEKNLARLLEERIAHDPALRDRLAGAEPDGRIVGWPLTTYSPGRRVIADRLMLIGDAAGLINPLNGEGIQYALESAAWAAETAAVQLAAGRLDALSLAPYAKAVRERMGYDMALAGLIIQIIRNRDWNPVWLKALQIIAARARHDDAYAAIAGGVLAGLTPAKRVVSTTMIAGTLRQAVLTLGTEAVFGAVRHDGGPVGFGRELAQLALALGMQSAGHPGATAGWILGVGGRSVRLASHVAGDLLSASVRLAGAASAPAGSADDGAQHLQIALDHVQDQVPYERPV